MLLMGNAQEFSEWLQKELERRGWNQAELSRRSGVSEAQITRIITTERGPGPDAAKAFAHALHYPEEFIFRKAGLLSEKPEDEPMAPSLAELIHLYLTASEEEQERMLEVIRVLSSQGDREPEIGGGET